MGNRLLDPTTYKTLYEAPQEAQPPIEVSEGATLVDRNTGQPIYTAPPKRQATPSGWQYKADGSGLEPIPGGPADPRTKAQEALPADIAGRLGGADVFHQDWPKIEAAITAGKLTGPIDAQMVRANAGEQGEIMRMIEGGKESLIRMQTGMGMSESEVRKNAEQYDPHPADKWQTVLSKANKLRQRLLAMEKRIMTGRGGMERSPNAASAAAMDAELDAIAAGKPPPAPPASSGGAQAAPASPQPAPPAFGRSKTQIYYNPQTGEQVKMQWNGSAWVPAQ